MSKKKSGRNKFMRYMSTEIRIEYKACLYFFAILVFYCGYLLLQQTFTASILYMAEIIFSTYIIGYLQVYFMGDFDESEHLGKREILCAFICTILYTLVSFLLGWFDQKVLVTVLFAAFIMFTYLCVFIINRIRRVWDTKELNTMLTAYKEGKTK